MFLRLFSSIVHLWSKSQIQKGIFQSSPPRPPKCACWCPLGEEQALKERPHSYKTHRSFGYNFLKWIDNKTIVFSLGLEPYFLFQSYPLRKSPFQLTYHRIPSDKKVFHPRHLLPCFTCFDAAIVCVWYWTKQHTCHRQLTNPNGRGRDYVCATEIYKHYATIHCLEHNILFDIHFSINVKLINRLFNIL